MNSEEKMLSIYLPGLSNNEAIDLCANHWHHGEGLYRGPIDKRRVNFDNSFAIIDTIDAYFSNKAYEVDADQFDTGFDEHYELEAFAKLVWLSNEYLSFGIHEPLGVHYNPRLEINAIHSGSTRNKVLRLFHEGAVDCLYFNTTGIKFDWMKDMEPVDIQSYANNVGFNVNVVADHGSLIPHINTVTNNISKIKETHKNIQGILNSDFRVYSNVVLPALEPWTVEHPKDATVKIRLQSGYTTSDKLRAIILAMLGKSYVGGY